MDDKDATLRGKLEDLFSDLNESIQAEASPAALPKGIPERAPSAEHQPTGQPLVALRALAEHTTDAILLSDLAGRVTFSNRACCDLLGYDYTPNEMVGLETAVLWPDEERVGLTGETPSGVPQALTGEWRGEAVQRRKDGSLLRASLTLFPIHDEQAQPIAVASIIRDLAEHKQAEEALVQERSLLRTLIDTLPDLIYVKDRQSRFVVVNQAQVRLLGGMTPEDLLGKSDLDFFPHELAQKYYTDEQAILQSGQPLINMEEPTVDAAGNKKWITTTKVPLRDSNGQVTGFVGVGRDITERKRTEEALAQEQYLMHTLMNNLPDHIYFKDAQSRFTRISKSQSDLFGLSDPAQVVGKSDFDFFSEEHARPAYEDEQEIIRTGQPLVGVEERETWADRPDTWVTTTKMPLRDEAGNIVGTFGISSDITERKRAEAERERLMDTLARRAVQLQTSAEVSHAAASILRLDELLPQTVELIRDHFGLYYTGIFLTDETGQWAVLRAGTGEAGHKMLEANHRLQIGGASMIGWCVANAQARIALDVGEEAVRFGNPLLPLTRSEMALPLVSRSRVIGAMTIQSDQPAAFTQEDISVLQSLADQTANAIENARLFEDARSRLAQLTALQETTRAVVSTLELDKLLHLITQQATTLLEGNGGITNLVDWEKKEDESVAACGSQVLTLGQRNSLEGGLSGWVAVHNQPVISNQLQNDDRVNLSFRSGILPGQNAAIVPFTIKDQVMGTLVVMDKQGGFDQADLDLLIAFANQAAIAIENARLFEQTLAARQQAEVRLREMQMLQQVIQAASGTLDLERVLDALFDVLAQQMGFTFIALNLIDESANEVRTVRAAGLARRMNGVVRPLSQMQNDIVVDVARKGQIEVIDGWDDRFSREIFEREGHAALVRAFVPLLLREKAIGTLEAGYNRQERAIITPEEVRLLGSLASQVAVAVENVRLFEASQRRATQERLTAAVTARMRETLDIDTVLQTAIREIGDAMGITEVEVRLASDVKNN